MRRKHLARLGRAPANCNRRDTAVALAGRSGHSSTGEERSARGDSRQPAAPDRPGYHGGVRCVSCVRRAALARRHQARQLWVLARELCSSAALYDMGGRGSAATRTLRLAFTVLRDRAGISEAERGRD
jgi:hypothetical protein